MTLIFFWGGGGGEEVRWKTVRTYGKILATPLARMNAQDVLDLTVMFANKEAAADIHLFFRRLCHSSICSDVKNPAIV